MPNNPFLTSHQPIITLEQDNIEISEIFQWFGVIAVIFGLFLLVRVLFSMHTLHLDCQKTADTPNTNATCQLSQDFLLQPTSIPITTTITTIQAKQADWTQTCQAVIEGAKSDIDNLFNNLVKDYQDSCILTQDGEKLKTYLETDDKNLHLQVPTLHWKDILLYLIMLLLCLPIALIRCLKRVSVDKLSKTLIFHQKRFLLNTMSAYNFKEIQSVKLETQQNNTNQQKAIVIKIANHRKPQYIYHNNPNLLQDFYDFLKTIIQT